MGCKIVDSCISFLRRSVRIWRFVFHFCFSLCSHSGRGTCFLVTRVRCSFFVSRFGLSLRLVSRGTSVRIRFGSPLSSNVVVCGHCLVTLSITINETLKWLSSLPILTQESFWWLQYSDRYIISLSLPPPPCHLPPSPRP